MQPRCRNDTVTNQPRFRRNSALFAILVRAVHSAAGPELHRLTNPLVSGDQ
jgi:hypothetical protein